MNQAHVSKKRGRFLVMPAFQLKFMSYIICFAVFGIAVLYASNYFYFERLLTQGQELGLPPDHVYFEFVANQKSLLNMTFFSVSVIVFGGLIIAGLALSHKIAGPVYRIQSYLKAIRREGEPVRKLKFRDGDFFPEVADLVNGLVEHYEKREE
jgi:hypothetical protein